MAINLWEAAGKPVAFSPLPVNSHENQLKINLYKNYIVTFKAMSASSSRLNVCSYNNVNDLYPTFALTNELKEYRFEWYESEGGQFWFTNWDGTTDIIILDIKLVEKPLVVIDYQKNLADVSVLADKSKFIYGSAYIRHIQQLKPTTTYTVSYYSVKAPPPGGWTVLDILNSAGSAAIAYLFNINNTGGGATGQTYAGLSRTFTTDSTGIIMWSCYDNFAGYGPQENWFTSLLTEIQLEEGPAKTSYKPYKKENKKSVKVPKLNLLPPFTEWILHANAKVISPYELELNATITRQLSSYSFKVIPNQDYTLTMNHNGSFDIWGSGKILDTTTVSQATFNSGNNTSLGLTLWDKGGVGKFTFSQPMLTLGSIPEPFEPYKGLNKPATQENPTGGVFMDGVTNYVHLPGMTMDSVEIDCLIDGSNVDNKYLMDARNGLPNGYINSTPLRGSDIADIQVNGGSVASYTQIPKDVRRKVLIKGTRTFTDDVKIFDHRVGSATGVERLKGILYGVKCLLNDQVVAEYDFTKENSIANNVIFGDKNWKPKLLPKR